MGDIALDRMHPLKLEQAVFASSDRGPVKGYQLVATSPGIDSDVSKALSRWCPSQMLVASPDHWTLNGFPVSDDLVAITRTVLGGPEYSRRGGSQVVTVILLADRACLAQFHHNPVLIARNAILFGHLKLPLSMSPRSLDLATLPPRPIIDGGGRRGARKHHPMDRFIDQALRVLEEGRRVALIGVPDPVLVAERLIDELPEQQRANTSFTTGLPPAVRRQYQIHFFPDANAPLQRTLASQQIECIYG